MIVDKVQIQNFKSIKNLTFEPRRFNLFIGEPNTGKSNILEALSMFSEPLYRKPNPREFDKKTMRFNEVFDLFYKQDFSKEIDICAGDYSLTINHHIDNNFISKYFYQNDFKNVRLTPFKYYIYSNLINYNSRPPEWLSTPFGENLLGILNRDDQVAEKLSTELEKFDLLINIEPFSNEIKLIDTSTLKNTHRTKIITYPYVSLSDTLKRIVFYYAAIKTNKDAVILFEEPETQTFPQYTRDLADDIIEDENNNQFFIITHNIYLFNRIVENANPKDLAIFFTYFDKDEYQTKVKKLSDAEIAKALEYDIDFFLNLHWFSEKKKMENK